MIYNILPRDRFPYLKVAGSHTTRNQTEVVHFAEMTCFNPMNQIYHILSIFNQSFL